MANNTKLKKRDATRIKVINAAIECIYTQGFYAAHTNRIADEADVSWGVIQYHFGDKDGLLQAVLEHIFDNFLTALDDAQVDDVELYDRVAQLTNAVWQLVSQKEYRVSVAILRNAGQDESSSIDGQKQIGMWAKQTSELWGRLFESDAHDSQQSEIAKHLFFATLRGLADEINPKKNRTKKTIDLELAALSDAITYLLSKS